MKQEWGFYVKEEKVESARKQLPLQELVYAPMQAVAEANIRLSEGIVEFLSATGDPYTDSMGKKAINLRTVQMIYDQMRSDSDDNTVADSISLEIPLLSIYPLSTMKISRTKIAFNTEVRDVQTVDGRPRILAEVTGGAGKEDAKTPSISFEIELEGVSPSEGLARFVDVLNSNAVPKQIARKPLDEHGNKLTGAQLEEYQKELEYTQKERRMRIHLSEAEEMIRRKNSELKMAAGMEYDEFSASGAQARDENIAEIVGTIEDYRDIKQRLERSLDQLRTERLRRKMSRQDEA